MQRWERAMGWGGAMGSVLYVSRGLDSLLITESPSLPEFVYGCAPDGSRLAAVATDAAPAPVGASALEEVTDSRADRGARAVSSLRLYYRLTPALYARVMRRYRRLCREAEQEERAEPGTSGTRPPAQATLARKRAAALRLAPIQAYARAQFAPAELAAAEQAPPGEAEDWIPALDLPMLDLVLAWGAGRCGSDAPPTAPAPAAFPGRKAGTQTPRAPAPAHGAA